MEGVAMSVIAIDGPSGAGKSTVAKAVARALGFAYLDTGAMYRAAAVWVERAGALDRPEAMADLVQAMPLEISLDPADQRVLLGDDDVTDLIRESGVSAMVSRVSTVIPARQVLVARQRQIVAASRQPGIVVEGRDITTVVAPEAEVRVLITAAPEVRLARRAKERLGVETKAALAAVSDEVLRRDRDDAAVAEFMEAPAGVQAIDTSDLGVDQVVAAVLALAQAA
jgi:cytidylate kinase